MKKKFEKLYVRLLVYDDVDLGLSRSMHCKEFSIIFRHYFASMFVWNIRTFKQKEHGFRTVTWVVLARALHFRKKC